MERKLRYITAQKCSHLRQIILVYAVVAIATWRNELYELVNLDPNAPRENQTNWMNEDEAKDRYLLKTLAIRLKINEDTEWIKWLQGSEMLQTFLVLWLLVSTLTTSRQRTWETLAHDIGFWKQIRGLKRTCDWSTSYECKSIKQKQRKWEQSEKWKNAMLQKE